MDARRAGEGGAGEGEAGGELADLGVRAQVVGCGYFQGGEEGEVVGREERGAAGAVDVAGAGAEVGAGGGVGAGGAEVEDGGEGDEGGGREGGVWGDHAEGGIVRSGGSPEWGGWGDSVADSRRFWDTGRVFIWATREAERITAPGVGWGVFVWSGDAADGGTVGGA